MPTKKDLTMLKADCFKLNIAMAENELEPMDLAERAGLPVNLIHTMRKGCYVKPKYFGAVSKALGVSVESIVDRAGGTYGDREQRKTTAEHNEQPAI